LYNLKDDIGEEHDLASTMPDKVDQLRKRLDQWRDEVGAQMPTPNPKHDPSKPEANLTPQQLRATNAADPARDRIPEVPKAGTK
jgi:hypothetical protein